MNFFWWLLTIFLMALGLLGTVLPVIPGTTIILAAAVIHRAMVGAEVGASWWCIGGLVVLTLLSYALDLVSSYFGAKYFGATKWGVIGAAIGVVVGLFTGFVTLLFAPVLGAIIGEVIAGKRLVSAGKAGWGTLLGNLAGMVGKLAIGFGMVVWWLLSAKPPL
ncbi:MAG: DUF456 family protein [Verrucomicrobiota bacterium]|nr:DUF456 family protein [Verrucomicrobiota bacterium]MDQ6940760.1 DUF456 family protein [Verrucomicrobiota bacterium]